MSVVAAIALVAVTADPRLELLNHQRAGEERLALLATERLAAAEPQRARELGLGLLRGHLLERLGRLPEAAAAYASAMGETPQLAPWARFRLAETQEALGHPEVAAGVAATLLSNGAPLPLVRPAVDLLVRSLRRGGDCRLLAGLPSRPWPRDLARRIELARAECLWRSGEGGAARQRIAQLLLAGHEDLAAFEAAELWLARANAPTDRELLRALGSALAGQRDFARAVPILEAALAGEERTGSARETATLYTLARSEFWLGRHGRAARVFEEIFRTTRSAAMRADARYQQARCLELGDDLAGANVLYREAFDLEPRGDWAGAALLARLRLEWLAGRRLEAGALLERLSAEREFRSALARGALFLAASEIVAGASSPEVAAWLDLVTRSGASSQEEVAYWRGRAAEIERRPTDAVRAYVEVLRERPFHPLAVAARARLAREEFRAVAEARGLELAAGTTLADVHAAWILLGPSRPPALAARARGLAALVAAPGVATWVRWTPTPTADWPLWRSPLAQPEERLLALGLFRDGAPAIPRHFPASRRELAFTAAQLLDAQGQSGQGIALAERLFSAKPERVPTDWVDAELRRLLFPLPYRQALLAQSSLRRVDPWLLAAILREESRFQTDAVSPVGARGLAQLVLPTARRLAGGLALKSPSAADLHRPEVTIPLAAVYLSELAGRFGGSEPAILAAYNAGEAQTELWRRYCTTAEPEELLAKIGFRETRAYVVRVLESRAHYAALYGL